MYAIIKSGGKQYRVKVGQVVRLEKLTAEPGQVISFDEVLLVANGDKVTVGTPTVESAKVNGEVVSHGRGKKVTIFKMKRRKKYRRTQGHRQSFTEVKISEIA